MKVSTVQEAQTLPSDESQQRIGTEPQPTRISVYQAGSLAPGSGSRAKSDRQDLYVKGKKVVVLNDSSSSMEFGGKPKSIEFAVDACHSADWAPAAFANVSSRGTTRSY